MIRTLASLPIERLIRFQLNRAELLVACMTLLGVAERMANLGEIALADSIVYAVQRIMMELRRIKARDRRAHLREVK